MDIHAAREAAKRFTNEPSNTPERRSDAMVASLALLAILDDPAVLLPAAKWEPHWESRMLRTVFGAYFCTPDAQAVGGFSWSNSKQLEVRDSPSLSAAQAACEEDMRERIRQLFRD